MRKWQRVNHDIFHFSLSFFSSLIVRAFQPVAAKQPPKKRATRWIIRKLVEHHVRRLLWKHFSRVFVFQFTASERERQTSARRQMLMSCDVESWKIILFLRVRSTASRRLEKTTKNSLRRKIGKSSSKSVAQVSFLCFARQQREDGIYFTLDKSHKLANWLFGIEFLSEQQYCMRADRNFLA